jgi:hypothetical protein
MGHDTVLEPHRHQVMINANAHSPPPALVVASLSAR